MMRYFKINWDETTGDELTDSWGESVFYFETDIEFNVLRQVQKYERFPEIVVTENVLWGQPRLEGRRLSVGDIISLISIN